jgi:hypothetical protein
VNTKLEKIRPRKKRGTNKTEKVASEVERKPRE